MANSVDLEQTVPLALIPYKSTSVFTLNIGTSELLTILIPKFEQAHLATYPCVLKLAGHHENMLYNFDPLKPHFYILKLGFTG